MFIPQNVTRVPAQDSPDTTDRQWPFSRDKASSCTWRSARFNPGLSACLCVDKIGDIFF